MVISFSISSYPKPLICFSECFPREIGRQICTVPKFPVCYPFLNRDLCAYQWKSKSNVCSLRAACNGFQSSSPFAYVIYMSKIEQRLTFKRVGRSRPVLSKHLEVSIWCSNMSTGISVLDHRVFPGQRLLSFLRQCTLSGIVFGTLVCCSISKPILMKAALAKQVKVDSSSSALDGFSHGKKVFVDYSVIGIPGDGRCLFRSIVHGVFIRSGKTPPNEGLQKDLADELRDRVADEFIKRRKETEWFIEGDFNTHVSRIRKPHVWGGEPELLMASYVIEMPISVYMRNDEGCGIILIAEYGQEYGKENPVSVLYHGFGHYEALIIPANVGPTSRL